MVKLYFDAFVDPELELKVPGYRVIRLLALTTFRGHDRWSVPKPAIVDTGAHISLIPRSLWRELPVRIIDTHYVRGVIPRKECSLPVRIGEVDCMVIDEEMNSLGPHRMTAFLADADDVPLLLGFRDMLASVRLVADHGTGEAFLEGA